MPISSARPPTSKRPSRKECLCLLAVALLGLSAATTVRAGDAAPPTHRATMPALAADQLGALDYRMLPCSTAAKTAKLTPDPDLRAQMDILDLEKSKSEYKEIKQPPPKPKLDTQCWVPSWMGTTGGMDLPWASVLPRGQAVVSLVAKERDAGAAYWPLVYRKLDGSDRGLTFGYGVYDGVEVTLDLDKEDRDFVYAPQINLNNPTAAPTSASFHGDRTLFGGGAKASYALDDLQVALGFHTTAFRNLDRNVIEFHDYDRMNNIYAVASTREGARLGGHFTARFVTYDWDGSIFPSGATTGAVPAGGSSPLAVDPNGVARQGFGPAHQRHGFPVYRRRDGSLTQNPNEAATLSSGGSTFLGTGLTPGQQTAGTLTLDQVGKGSNHWINLGFGADFLFGKRLRLLGEINWETALDFVADPQGNVLESWFLNLGLRYEQKSWAATVGMRHLNTTDYREPVASVAWRF
ncbi:MAG: hypothetical protein HY814_11820 [Candidatus Riflebacteria bacterium]|nr:hypothetical protein [Candidatus Riflebacteria bacterium]